jgi:hypothetical protein
VAVQYTIDNTVPGANGLTLRLVAAQAKDLLWSPVQQRIYFTAPSTSATYGNMVAVLNATTASVESSSFVGSEPSEMALSDDGQYLYVALDGANSVRRKLLPSLTQDLLIPMGSDPSLGALIAADIAVAPGQPNTIAVARKTSTTYQAGVVIYDNAVPRANVAGVQPNYVPINSVNWGNTASVLYGATTQAGAFAVATMNVDASGATLLSTQSGVSTSSIYGRIHLANNVLYSDGGEAFDPITQSTLGMFAPPQYGFSRVTIPDTQHNKLFMVATGSGGGLVLRSFNLTTYAPIDSVNLDGIGGLAHYPYRLIRWGADGLAFAVDDGYSSTLIDGRIVLINGPFVSNLAN